MDIEHTTVAITGNTFFVNRPSRYRLRPFLELVEHLRGADVTVANLECTIPAPGTPPAFVAGSGWGATYMGAAPWIVEELAWLGIDAVCTANNHTADFGAQGVLDTIQALESGDMAYAGFGASLAEATAPTFVDAASGARVALIAATDWGPRGAMGLDMPWPMGHMASDEGPPFTSRPGLNLLRYEAVTEVRSDDLETLRRLSAELDWDRDKVSRSNGGARSHPLVGMTTNLGVEVESDTEVFFLGRRFVLGDEAGTRTVPCEADMARIERAVRQAARQADIVCVALHDQAHGEAVHDYITAFAHRVIDAGADVYCNNGGTHKGVELYQGKPIIYGVPNLLLQTEAIPTVPSEARQRFGVPDATAAEFIDARASGAREAAARGAGNSPAFVTGGGSAVFECRYGPDLALAEVVLRPFEHADLFPGASGPAPTHRLGLPVAPAPDSPVRQTTLAAYAERSRTHGVEIRIRDGLGVIEL